MPAWGPIRAKKYNSEFPVPPAKHQLLAPYDKDSEVGMQKGTLYRTQLGVYLADVGNGPDHVAP